MADYLLEIGVEELPAGYIPEAQDRLKQSLAESLEGAKLPFRGIRSYSTPRRLAILVDDLAGKQATTTKQEKGPPVDRSFDASGAPTVAATKFAEKCGLKVDQLKREKIGGTEYLVADVTTEGKSAAAVLGEIVPKCVEKLTGERLMRWGSSDFKFSRPIRWIVSLLGHDVVPIVLDGIPTGRESAGHRILNKGKVKISTPDKYMEELKKAYVIVDPDERRKIIEEQVTQLAQSKDGVPKQLKGALLEEVVHITEWPHAVAGEFAKEYLELPDTLIETIMVHHQRYFPVERKDAKPSQKVNKNDLLPYFIAVANNDRKDAEAIIKQGNERVLRARLADGSFFYKDDQKTKLAERKSGLRQLTFQEGLGSYNDKVERIVKLSRHVASSLKLDDRLSICLERTMELCKVDLVTNLVRELPELQGHVGAWYAEKENEPPDVVKAIASHYSPRSTEDSIPKDTVGMLASVVDKLDSVVGLFALGKKPSGSSDPYALRRQAQGVIDISIDGLKQYPINITEAMNKLLDSVEPQVRAWIERQPEKKRKEFDRAAILADLHDFLLQRLKGKLLALGAEREVVDAVLSARDPLQNLPDCAVRCTCLADLMASEGGLDLLKAGVRVGNILKDDSPERVDPALFTNDSEKKLWDIFNRDVVKQWQANGSFTPPENKADYERLLEILRALNTPVDDFFTNVMVNDQDATIRANRHGLLKQIDRYFRTIADFPKFKSLLV